MLPAQRVGENVLSPSARSSGFSGRGAQAELLCSTWDPPGPGVESMTLVLTDKVFTTEPPGNPLPCSLVMPLVVGKAQWKRFQNHLGLGLRCLQLPLNKGWGSLCLYYFV